jgi:hypothetical protein
LKVNAPFGFMLANSGGLTVNQGSSASNTVTATLVSGSTQPVSFAVSGLPQGTSASFSQSTCSPNCSSQLTVSTSSSTPAGSYSLTVKGTAGSVTSSTAVALTVNALSTTGSTSTSTTTTVTARYYVDADTGNDLNPGSKVLPFLTIQKGVNVARPGDTVLVQQATNPYYECITFPISGTSSNPITLQFESLATKIHCGSTLSSWTHETGIAAGVYSHAVSSQAGALHQGGKKLPRINDLSMAGQIIQGTDNRTGDQILGWSPTATCNHGLGLGAVNCWDGVEGIWGFRNGRIYVSFRNDDNPASKALRWSPTGGTVRITNKSYITIDGGWIVGGEYGVLVEGSSSKNIVIKNGKYTGGQKGRIGITNGASATVLNNEILADWLGFGVADPSYIPGPWRGTTTGTYAERVAGHLYGTDKFISGATTEQDSGVDLFNNPGTVTVTGNNIHHGLVGVRCFGGSTVVEQNDFNGFPTESIWLVHECSTALVSQNYFINHTHAIRIQDLNDNSTVRNYQIDRNKYWNPDQTATAYKHINCSFQGVSGQTVTNNTTIWVVHNSFAGGGWAVDCGNTTEGNWQLPNLRIVNNVFSSRGIHSSGGSSRAVFASNWNRGTGFGYPDADGNNVAGDGTRMWSDATKVTDFTLPKGIYPATAKQIGIDVSGPFSIDGMPYSAMRGFSPGYFSGVLPHAGAVQ